jgi:hypothetical protein
VSFGPFLGELLDALSVVKATPGAVTQRWQLPLAIELDDPAGRKVETTSDIAGRE